MWFSAIFCTAASCCNTANSSLTIDEKIAHDADWVYICIKTQYYGKAKYIFYETK